MSDFTRLFEFAFSGRAILFVGQDLVPDSATFLRDRIAKASDAAASAGLVESCESLSDPSPILSAVKSLEETSASVSLRRVAEVPWAAVFTSALDDSLSRELATQDSQGRRLRHVCLNEQLPAFFPRRNDVLTVFHLSHLANEKALTGLPLFGRQWGKAKRFQIPGVLKDLPQVVGPAHLLCIAGIGSDDVVDPNLVADFTAELDPDNVYWFTGTQNEAEFQRIRKLVPNIHVIQTDLASALESHLEKAPKDGGPLGLKEKVLELQDLAVTVSADDNQRLVAFKAGELREFRRHLVIIPDLHPKAAPVEVSKRKQDFIHFLSENRQTPEWSGISQGFAFHRNAYSRLLDLVLERVRVILGPTTKSHSQKRSRENAPIFLAGPPASGRTVGLLWLGYELRRKGVFVVQLLPSGGMIDAAAVEQILRLAEGRGAPATVVLLDRAERRIAENLDRQLRSAGRRSIVVASVAPEMSRPRAANTDAEIDDEETFQGTEVLLDYALTQDETERFRHYLQENYGSVDADLIVRLLSSDPSVFALLYRLIPDTRENIRTVLIDEYLNLVEGLASFNPPKQEEFRGSSLRDQLKIWLEQHKQIKADRDEASFSAMQPDLWHNIATQLPQLVLLFSSLDEPISLNLLSKRFPGLLKVYRSLREALENSGMFQEVALDRENDIGLTAVNPLVAQLLLNAAMPSSVGRINLLAGLLYEFPWDSEARPIDAPEQSLLIHIIRSISLPSGVFQAEYQRTEDLKALAEVLRKLREDYHSALPTLLLVEGILLRHIGRRLGDDDRSANALSYYRLSRTVLEMAREILSRRRPSPGRNFEISTVLNAIAATIGHTFNLESRVQNTDEGERRELVQKALDTANESRAYAEAYHPLDTAFWTNRDFYRYLSERPDSPEVRLERQHALLNMGDALDKAQELGELPHDQADKLTRRIVELKAYLGDLAGAKQKAEEDAKAGRFAGICLLSRMNAIDSRTNAIISSEAAHSALKYLDSYTPKILNDDRALTLMHRLWIGARLGNYDLDEGPFAIACARQDWTQLERIASARRTLAGNTRIPYINFWLAVALAHQGDIRRTLQMLEEIQANSLAFVHRRLSPLIYLSDERGTPQKYSAVVRRRDEDNLLTLYIPSVGIEVKMSQRYQGVPSLINVQRGDEVTSLVALSYWNPMALSPVWEEARLKKSNAAQSSKNLSA